MSRRSHGLRITPRLTFRTSATYNDRVLLSTLKISPARSAFFFRTTILFFAIAVTGFSTTFFIPVARGTFDAPVVIHVHAALLFGWLLLLIAQSFLVRTSNIALHKRIGWWGATLALSIVLSGVLVGIHATRRDLAQLHDDFVLGQLFNIVIEMALFGGLVAAAILLRRDGESHKRLLLLATISVLAPAWLRLRHLFPAIPNPFVTLSFAADSLVLVLIVRDWITLRRVHPVYIWAGGGMVLVHMIELAAITSPPWLWLSAWLLRL